MSEQWTLIVYHQEAAVQEVFSSEGRQPQGLQVFSELSRILQEYLTTGTVSCGVTCNLAPLYKIILQETNIYLHLKLVVHDNASDK